MEESLESLLMQLGLSGLEADAYLAVLSEPGSTAYRVSQVLGKAAPNTYKALDSLVVKGAVLADDGGGSRTFVAVPVRELIGQMNSRLQALAGRIEKGLENVHRPLADEGAYKLTTVHQILARAREMIAGAKLSIVVDADSRPMKALLDDLLTAPPHGVKVLLHGREEFEAPGCEVISSITEGWSGELLIMMVDGNQYLISMMSTNMHFVHHAVWSRNPLLSACLYRSYMVKALFYRISMMLGDKSRSIEEIRSELVRLWDTWGYDDAGKAALTKLLRNL
jgi:predicted transcriptional regulator